MEMKIKVFFGLLFLSQMGLAFITKLDDLPKSLRGETLSFLSSDMPTFVNRAIEMQRQELKQIVEQRDRRLALENSEPQLEDARSLQSAGAAAPALTPMQLQKLEDKIERALRQKSTALKGKAKKHKKGGKHRARRSLIKTRVKKHHAKKSKAGKRAAKAKLSKHAKALQRKSRGLAKAASKQHKIHKRHSAATKHQRKTLKATENASGALAGRLLRKPSRKLGVGETIMSNILPIGAAVGAGGLLTRHIMDKIRFKKRSNLKQMSAHMKLKHELMEEALATIDRINNGMRSEATKLKVEKDLFNKKFETNIEQLEKGNI